jgi:hypothetical protein
MNYRTQDRDRRSPRFEHFCATSDWNAFTDVFVICEHILGEYFYSFWAHLFTF